MKLPVAVKLLNIEPDQDIFNYDFDDLILKKVRYSKIKDDPTDPNQLFADSKALGFIYTPWGPDVTIDDNFETTFKNQSHPLFPLVMNEVKKVEELLNATARLATISGLAPGGEILEHTDKSPIFLAVHRVHLPLRTDNNVKFRVDGIAYNFEIGKFYEFDNTRPHAVTNDSEIERIHLIIDLTPNKI
jgi:hypothetical protein